MKYYVEAKDKNYIIHPTENHILREPEESKCLRHQYKVLTGTKVGQNQKVIRSEEGHLIVKSYAKT